MRTIKTYSKRAPFYNAFLGTNPTDELITSRLPVFWSEWEIGGNSLTQAITRARLTHN
jgi:hypothetical protein